MKLQLTNTGQTLLDSIKKLDELGFINEYSYGDRFMFALEEIVLNGIDYNSKEDLKDIRNHQLVEKALELDLLILV